MLIAVESDSNQNNMQQLLLLAINSRKNVVIGKQIATKLKSLPYVNNFRLNDFDRRLNHPKPVRGFCRETPDFATLFLQWSEEPLTSAGLLYVLLVRSYSYPGRFALE